MADDSSLGGRPGALAERSGRTLRVRGAAVASAALNDVTPSAGGGSSAGWQVSSVFTGFARGVWMAQELGASVADGASKKFASGQYDLEVQHMRSVRCSGRAGSNSPGTSRSQFAAPSSVAKTSSVAS